MVDIRTFKLPQISLGLIAFAALEFTLQPSATAGGFRTIDGSQNNIDNPQLGAAYTELMRLFPPAYEDDISIPRGGDFKESILPNPRTISNTIANQTESVTNFLNASDWLWQWGQFIDHDLDLNEANEENPPAPEDNTPIPVPQDNANDPFVQSGITELPFIRVPAAGGTGETTPRQQINQITSFLDASSVYGSDSERANALRAGEGQLKTTTGKNGETLLPLNTGGLPNASGGLLTDPNDQYFAGDIRVNEQVGLTAVHTLFVREHNRLAVEIQQRLEAGEIALVDKLRDSGLSQDDFLYQTARKVVGAQIQVITYNEFLPLLIGETLEPYTGYNPNVDPSISNEFANAAYRLGHTLLSPQLLLIDEDGTSYIALEDAFFNPKFITAKGVDSLFLGLAAQAAQELDNQIVEGVRNFLFPAGTGGLDLASVNIARGREVGLPSYVDVFERLGLGIINDFDDLPFASDVITLFQRAYGSVDEIELWSGGISELPIYGSLLGPTFSRIISDQFLRLRDGDRFFYLNPDQLEHLVILDPDILNTTLSDIIRRNSNDFVAANIQDNAFTIAQVPERSSLFSLLTLVAFGASSLLLRKCKSGKGRQKVNSKTSKIKYI